MTDYICKWIKEYLWDFRKRVWEIFCGQGIIWPIAGKLREIAKSENLRHGRNVAFVFRQINTRKLCFARQKLIDTNINTIHQKPSPANKQMHKESNNSRRKDYSDCVHNCNFFFEIYTFFCSGAMIKRLFISMLKRRYYVKSSWFPKKQNRPR